MRNLLALLVCFLTFFNFTDAYLASTQHIEIGVLSFQPKSLTSQKWSVLGTYLEKQIPGFVFSIVPMNQVELNDAIATKKLDYVLTNPSHYIVLSSMYGLSAPLATAIRGTKDKVLSSFGGVIYTLSDRADIIDLTDIADKTIAIPFKAAFGAFQVQQYELLLAELPLINEEQFIVTGLPHDNSVYAVLNGQADIGFARAGTLERMADEGKLRKSQLKVINAQPYIGFPIKVSTSLYPEWPIAALSHVDSMDQRQITIALLKMEEEASGTLPFHVRGFIPPANYNSVENLMRTLRVAPFDTVAKVTMSDIWILYKTQIVIFTLTLLTIILLGVYLFISRHQLNLSEQRFKALHNASFGGIAIHDKGVILECNKGLSELTGYSVEELIGMDGLLLIAKKNRDMVMGNILAGYEAPYEAIGVRKNGNEYPVRLEARSIPYQRNEARVVEFRDISNQKRAEAEQKMLQERLKQAQKMEAIGTLAGGIAHDFNNILAAILGYADMARDDCQSESTVAKDLDKVLEAGYRARDLVQQILTFSRQHELARIPLQPQSIVKEAIKMLRSSLPTTIEIEQDITAPIGLVLADPTQIHQILMNLCTNAFHAMEKSGGKLGISLKEVTFSSEDLVHEANVEAGTFVQFSIRDSGCGIEPDIKNKIFEPYFTTKETGKGTGMGLATVHGIVKSYGGFISLYSELGEGTAFHVFLPVIEKELQPDEIKTAEQIPIGRERILFIDDEEILAEMGKDMLERLGYHVTVRNNSLEALKTFQSQPNQFDIIITDQTMPRMTGADLARRMIQIRPDIPIILCTGYSTIISEEKAKSMGIKEFALKPLSNKDIALLVRKVLDNNQS